MNSDPKNTQDSSQPVADDRRSDERLPFDGDIRIRFLDPVLVGPGENISGDGVFFVTEGSVRVEVTTTENEKVYLGELVRLHSMGGGKTGVAVRFETD